MWVVKDGDVKEIEDGTYSYWRSLGYVEWEPDASAASSALSAGKVAGVFGGPLSTVIAAGTDFNYLDFTGATLLTGADVFGVGGASSLPLTVNTFTLVYPDVDTAYDIAASLQINGNAADAGLFVEVWLMGVNSNVRSRVQLDASGQGLFAATMRDFHVLTGTVGAGLSIVVDARRLTVNATASNLNIVVFKPA